MKIIWILFCWIVIASSKHKHQYYSNKGTKRNLKFRNQTDNVHKIEGNEEISAHYQKFSNDILKGVDEELISTDRTVWKI